MVAVAIPAQVAHLVSLAKWLAARRPVCRSSLAAALAVATVAADVILAEADD